MLLESVVLETESDIARYNIIVPGARASNLKLDLFLADISGLRRL